MWRSSLYIIRTSDDGFDKYEEYEVIPETVGQFTGFFDRKGNRIFEGGIVSCRYKKRSKFIGEIVLEKGAFGIGSSKELPLDLDFWCGNDNFVSLWEIYWNLDCEENELPMIEVIGNRYDNLNLLLED